MIPTKAQEEDIPSTDYALSDSTIMTNTTDVNVTSTATSAPTDAGISLPGYLQIDPRVDMRERINGVLAKGSFGAVILADAFKSDLVKRAGPLVVIEKMTKMTKI